MRRGAGFVSEDAAAADTHEAMRPPPIPNLPGHSYFSHALNQTAAQLGARKPRVATLKFVRGYPVVEDPVVPEQDPLNLKRYSYTPGQEALVKAIRDKVEEQANPPQQSTSQATWGVHSIRWTGAKTPGWLKYDKKVLTFFAYSLDKVMYSPLEDMRVRRFQFQFHLEDNSLEVTEPQVANSGIPQGKYLQRHKVKLADGSELRHDQLRVGTELTLYSRKFIITGCDAPTRAFYADELRQPQAPDMAQPQGKYDDYLKKREAEEDAKRLRTTQSSNKAKQAFLEGDEPLEETRGPAAFFEYFEDRKVQEHLDRKILRFYCCWDDTKRMFGQKLPFALHYYLCDDTIEVAESHMRNTGRDPFPLLLSRCKLPRTPNVPPVGGRPMSPKSKKNLGIQYYHWKDLRIGSVVKVYGRDLQIYDMDVFTRGWLKEFGGQTDKDLVPIEVDFSLGPKRPPLQVPPNTMGIGSEEDSLQNVLYLVPRRHQATDYYHYMENWNKVLRFSARMVPAKGFALVGPHDAERRFIVSFHLLDKTITIFEPKRSNSGMRGGTFLERTKVRKHNAEQYFSDEDFQVGSVLVIYSRAFELLDADHFTLRHMESDGARYPHADYDKVVAKVRAALGSDPRRGEELKSALIQLDEDGNGYVTKEQLQAALRAAGADVTLHEAITLVRVLGADLQGVVTESLLAALGLIPRRTPDMEDRAVWVHEPYAQPVGPQSPSAQYQQLAYQPLEAYPHGVLPPKPPVAIQPAPQPISGGQYAGGPLQAPAAAGAAAQKQAQVGAAPLYGQQQVAGTRPGGEGAGSKPSAAGDARRHAWYDPAPVQQAQQPERGVRWSDQGAGPVTQAAAKMQAPLAAGQPAAQQNQWAQPRVPEPQRLGAAVAAAPAAGGVRPAAAAVHIADQRYPQIHQQQKPQAQQHAQATQFSPGSQNVPMHQAQTTSPHAQVQYGQQGQLRAKPQQQQMYHEQAQYGQQAQPKPVQAQQQQYGQQAQPRTLQEQQQYGNVPPQVQYGQQDHVQQQQFGQQAQPKPLAAKQPQQYGQVQQPQQFGQQAQPKPPPGQQQHGQQSQYVQVLQQHDQQAQPKSLQQELFGQAQQQAQYSQQAQRKQQGALSYMGVSPSVTDEDEYRSFTSESQQIWHVLAGAPAQQMYHARRSPPRTQEGVLSQRQRLPVFDEERGYAQAPPALNEAYGQAQAQDDADLYRMQIQQQGGAPQLRASDSGGGYGYAQQRAGEQQQQQVRYGQELPAAHRDVPVTQRMPQQQQQPRAGQQQQDRAVLFNAPSDDWMAAAAQRQQRIDDERGMPRSRHTQDAPVLIQDDVPRGGNAPRMGVAAARGSGAGSFAFQPPIGFPLGGKENAGPPDPRFFAPPGGIGYGLGATGAKKPEANRAAMDALAKQTQPKSLWKTSKQAAGF